MSLAVPASATVLEQLLFSLKFFFFYLLLLFFFSLIRCHRLNANFLTSHQLHMSIMFRPWLDLVHITMTSSWRHRVSNYPIALTRALSWRQMAFLTPSLRRPCIHAIFFPTACRTACKHAFCFFLGRPEAVSTRHSWLWQTLDDVYTRRCFSESEGTRFGAPGQKALPSGNECMEWNEWMDFCLIPLSTTGSVPVPGTNL